MLVVQRILVLYLLFSNLLFLISALKKCTSIKGFKYSYVNTNSS